MTAPAPAPDLVATATRRLAGIAGRAARVSARRAETAPAGERWEELAAAHAVVGLLAGELARLAPADADAVTERVWELLQIPVDWADAAADAPAEQASPPEPVELVCDDDDPLMVVLWDGHTTPTSAAIGAARAAAALADEDYPVGPVRRVWGRWSLAAEMDDGRITYPSPYHLWWDERTSPAAGYQPTTVIEIPS
jgi:hypothetical protein